MNIIISGNLTRDVELKYFESGKIKASFSLAINVFDAVKKEKVAHFFNCEAWDKKAEFIADKYKKGQALTIEGFYKRDEYIKDNVSKTRNTFIVNNVVFTEAFGFVSGVVEKEEKRFTKNNVSVEFIKFENNDIIIKNLSDKKEVKVGDFCSVIGTLTQTEDKKVILTAINIEKSEAKQEGNIKFADVELSQEDIDEIPF